jgi:hypothetical protein
MVGPDDAEIKTVVVYYAWEEVAPIVEGSTTEPTTEPEIPAGRACHPARPPSSRIPPSRRAGTGGSSGARTPPLAGPLRALLNLLPVSRGQTVTSEISGAVIRASRTRSSCWRAAPDLSGRHRSGPVRRLPQHAACARLGDRVVRGRQLLPTAAGRARLRDARGRGPRTYVRFRRWGARRAAPRWRGQRDCRLPGRQRRGRAAIGALTTLLRLSPVWRRSATRSRPEAAPIPTLRSRSAGTPRVRCSLSGEPCRATTTRPSPHRRPA